MRGERGFRSIGLRMPVHHIPSRPPRIAVVACTGGAGHLRAGQALVETARSLDVPVEIEFWDVLSFTAPWFRRMYADTYLHMINRTPELWGYLYERTERHPHENSPLIRAFDRVNYDRYWRALKHFQPDVLLCTHFLAYLSIAQRLRRWEMRPRVHAATTDFDVHRLWIHDVVDRYYVFHQESRWQLTSKGVDENRICVTGIPVHPPFTRRVAPESVRARLGLGERRTTILVVAGGFGVGRVHEIASTVASTLGRLQPRRYNLVVVCGRNEEALRRVRSAPPPPNVALHPVGFVDNMHDWMDAADLLVSKSGGLTSAEALAKGLPLVVIDPIPGQESRNADLMVEQGAAWKAIDLSHLAYKLTHILTTPTVLAQHAPSGSLTPLKRSCAMSSSTPAAVKHVARKPHLP